MDYGKMIAESLKKQEEEQKNPPAWKKKIIKKKEYCKHCEDTTMHVKLVNGTFTCSNCSNVTTIKEEGRLFGVGYWEK